MTVKMDLVDLIQLQVEKITDACDTITDLYRDHRMDAEEWRLVLGAVELASKDTYKLKRKMLDEALKIHSVHYRDLSE